MVDVVPPSRLAPLRTTRGLALLVAAVAILAYANALNNGWAFDDDQVIARNDAVHDLARIPDLFTSKYWAIVPTGQALYRPVAMTSYAVGWTVWGGEPWGFHLVNVLLHGAVTVLVLLVLLRLGRPFGAGKGAAVAGALLFALHPVHVEAVANVVGRAELLAALFSLVVVYAYLRRDWRPWRRAVVAGAAWLLALGSKEIALALPGVLLLLEAARPPSPPLPQSPSRGGAEGKEIPSQGWVARLGSEWRGAVSLAAALALFLALRRHALGEFLGNDVAPYFVELSTWERVLTAVRLWPEYVRLMVFPLDLVADYSPAVILPVHEVGLMVVLGLALGLVALAVGVVAWRRQRLFALGLAWFAITVFPVSNLVVAVGITLAERTLYLPSVGVSLIAVGLVAEVRRRPDLSRRARRALAVAGVVVLGLFAARTWTRTPVWRSTGTVLNSLVRNHPESFRAQWAIAGLRWRQGRLEEAIRYYERAQEIVGAPWFQLLVDHGLALTELDRLHDAVPLFRRAVETIPEHRDGHRFLTNTLLRLQRYREARDAARNGLRFFPDDPRLLDALAFAASGLGDWDAARRARQRHLEADPDADAGAWVHLALTHVRLDQRNAAAAALDSARARADDPAAIPELERLAPPP